MCFFKQIFIYSLSILTILFFSCDSLSTSKVEKASEVTDVVEGIGVESVIDTDGDTIEDSLDNCVDVANPDQLDDDGNGVGNLCEVDMTDDAPDDDAGDGGNNGENGKGDENTGGDQGTSGTPPADQNPDGNDNNDGGGKTTNPGGLTSKVEDKDKEDKDKDGVKDSEDNCPDKPNAYQTDTNKDGKGDACEVPISQDPETTTTGKVSISWELGPQVKVVILSFVIDGKIIKSVTYFSSSALNAPTAEIELPANSIEYSFWVRADIVKDNSTLHLKEVTTLKIDPDQPTSISIKIYDSITIELNNSDSSTVIPVSTPQEVQR